MIYTIIEINTPFNHNNTTVLIKWIGTDYNIGKIRLKELESFYYALDYNKDIKPNFPEISHQNNDNLVVFSIDNKIYRTIGLNEIDAEPTLNNYCEIELN